MPPDRGGAPARDDTSEGCAARAIVAAREVNGPFRCISDLARRVPLSLRVLEGLSLVGAFDEFGLARREALWQAGLLIPAKPFGPKREGTGTERGQQTALPLPVEQDMVSPAPMTAWDRSRAEYEGLGLSPHWHPLLLLRSGLPEAWATAADLEDVPPGSSVTVVGLVVRRQQPDTSNGVVFLTLEDETGLINVVVYPALYERERNLVRHVRFLVVEGRLQKEHGTLTLLAQAIYAMPLPDRDGQISDEPGAAVEEVPMPPAQTYR